MLSFPMPCIFISLFYIFFSNCMSRFLSPLHCAYAFFGLVFKLFSHSLPTIAIHVGTWALSWLRCWCLWLQTTSWLIALIPFALGDMDTFVVLMTDGLIKNASLKKWHRKRNIPSQVPCLNKWMSFHWKAAT